jgi:sugar lactone lactonase YvrE
MNMVRRGRAGLAIASVAVSLALVATAAGASGVTTVLAFNPAALEAPEGVAVDRKGNIFVGMAFTGEIKKVTPGGMVSTFADLDPSSGFLTGLAFDRAGNLYAALASFVPATHGIWRVSQSGATVRFAALDPTGLPNVLAFDRRGNLYVSDSILGRIWKISKQGAVSVWKADPLLAGLGLLVPLIPPVGANGLAFDEEQENLFVVNTEKGLIARIDVRSNGTAGDIHVFVQDPGLFGADGCTFDDDDNLYVAVNGQDSIARVSEEGSVAIVAQGGLLQNPAEVRFGVGKNDETLYITNFALFRFLGLTPGPPRPALLSLAVDDDEETDEEDD